jgi:DNA-binding transcriptional LysR family regulator
MKRRYFKEFRFRQIRALVELHRHGGFAEVARQLQLSVPSVWQQIRALEDEFKVRLAIARGNKVELTDDGLLLAELAAPVVSSFESLRFAFSERQKGLKRELTLATTTSLLTYDLPPVIAAYRRTHPEVQITFIEQPSHEARATFEQGRADLAIVGAAASEPGPHYHAEPVTDYSAHLVCPAGHELLKSKRLTLAQIARHPLVLPVIGGVLRERVTAVFAEAGLRDITVSVSANSLSLVNGYVRMGYGVGLVSLSPVIVSQWMESGGHDLHLRDVSKLFGKESVFMLHRPQGHEMSHVRAFREAVVKG